MPSLAISFVLAVFYVASLVFYAVNRQQDGYAAEIVTVSHDNESRQQQTVSLTVQQDTSDSFEYLCNTDFSQFYSTTSHENALLSSILHYFRCFLPDITVSILDTEIFWKFFSRPPPVS